MPRPEKVQAVAEIKERIESAGAVFLAEYSGLSVQEQQVLRRNLKRNGAEFKVVKMTLARRAAAELDIDSLDDLLLGPTGLAFAHEDAVTAAKALRDFAKDHEVFTIKGGLLGRDFLTPERIDELADIESRDVLLARALRTMEAPLVKLAGLLAALPRGFATALHQLIEKMPAEQPTGAAGSADAVAAPEGGGPDGGDGSADTAAGSSEGAVPAEAAAEAPADAGVRDSTSTSGDDAAEEAEEE